jgi:putative sigma-54 modulation protein
MKVHFTGRHVELSDALKQHAQGRLDKLASFLDDIIDVHVIFSVEKQHRHTAEITLKTRSASLVASAESQDMYSSLNQAVDKLEAQAHKTLDKRSDRRQNGDKAGTILAAEVE